MNSTHNKHHLVVWKKILTEDNTASNSGLTDRVEVNIPPNIIQIILEAKF